MASSPRLESIAVQLASVWKEQDGEIDDNKIQDYMTELASSCLTVNESRVVVRRAVELWQSTDEVTMSTTTATASKSFSLLDQFSSFSERVFFHQIQDATGEEERLKLLQKVDHIDDVLTDWKEVQTMLQGGLLSDRANYLDLHSKWFHQCQETTEYQSIRFGLCFNILFSLRQHFGRQTTSNATRGVVVFSKEEELTFRLVQTWCSMWNKLIHSGAYLEEEVDTMMLQVLTLMRQMDAKASSAQFVLLPRHWFALCSSDWIQSWLEETPVHRIRSVVQQSGLVCYSELASQQSSSLEVNTNIDTKNLVTEGVLSVPVSTLEAKVQKQTRALVGAVLVHLRVHMFPWKDFWCASTAVSQELVDRKLQKGASSSQHQHQPIECSEAELLDFCNNFCNDDAVESLLWGCAASKRYRHYYECIKNSVLQKENLRIQQLVESIEEMHFPKAGD